MKDCLLTIEFSWTPQGEVRLDSSNRLEFPKTSEKPGLYKFEFSRDRKTLAYIGEADRLRRRFQHYRTPGPSQSTNIRIESLLREMISQGIAVSLAVVEPPAHVTTDSGRHDVALLKKSERVLVEQAAIYLAGLSGLEVLNL